MPRRDRKAERREATRQEIVEAAWEIARERGLAQLTLREVGERIGMRAPSLYSHYGSKNAIYDAMFEQAWSECERVSIDALRSAPTDPRGLVRVLALAYFDFAVADLARYQLMNQRTIPGFEPSPEAYVSAVRALDEVIAVLATIGVTDRDDVEIWIAILSGLVDQQLANDPGGHSRRKLLDRAVDMWADSVGLPPTKEPQK
ncbi:TetR/AcrR family transcriptional regulator [Nocardia sp. NPDC003183]